LPIGFNGRHQTVSLLFKDKLAAWTSRNVRLKLVDNRLSKLFPVNVSTNL
jgi:hypothetical protein